MMHLISYGGWYYDHASTFLPVLTHEDGTRSDWGKVSIALANGDCVFIRPATPPEHDLMCERFDQTVDQLAADGFAYGLGNFDKDNPPADLKVKVGILKSMARIEARWPR